MARFMRTTLQNARNDNEKVSYRKIFRIIFPNSPYYFQTSSKLIIHYFVFQPMAAKTSYNNPNQEKILRMDRGPARHWLQDQNQS